MNRCGDCDWLVIKKQNPSKGHCIVEDVDKLVTDKRCGVFENDKKEITYDRTQFKNPTRLSQ